MVYYNEFDPKAAAWLRELINADLIAKGEVDERSISDVRGSDLVGFSQCHLFAGIGGWSYALRLAGWPDTEPVWTGSCPCQPFSQAGKGAGESDKRHLWPDFRRLIEECSPPAVFGEQVASKAGRGWLNGVRTDLEAMAYEVGAADLCSAGVGAPHIRQRLYWVGHSTESRRTRNGIGRTTEPARDETRLGEPSGSSASIWMGEPMHAERRALNGPGEDVIDRDDTRRSQAHGEPGASGEVRRLGDSDNPRSQGRRLDAGEYANQRATGAAGSVGGMGNATSHHERREREPGSGERWNGATGGSSSGRDGFWSAFDIVHCTDNKARRIEPCTFPLAHGIPARMGRLRGYGNAITPEVAAEFVMAFVHVSQGFRMESAAGNTKDLNDRGLNF